MGLSGGERVEKQMLKWRFLWGSLGKDQENSATDNFKKWTQLPTFKNWNFHIKRNPMTCTSAESHTADSTQHIWAPLDETYFLCTCGRQGEEGLLP